PRNMTRSGHACPGDFGWLPRISTVGYLGRYSPGFGITLNATPNRLAVLLLGMERGTPPVINLTGLGAPGCMIGVAPGATLMTATDAHGVAWYPVNVPKLLSIHHEIWTGQWIVHAPSSNALGLATSEVG